MLILFVIHGVIFNIFDDKSFSIMLVSWIQLEYNEYVPMSVLSFQELIQLDYIFFTSLMELGSAE